MTGVGVGVGEGAQGGLVIGEGGAAGEGEHAGVRVIRGGDAARRGDGEHILAGCKIGADGHRAGNQVRAVGIGDGDAATNGQRALPLGVGLSGGIQPGQHGRAGRGVAGEAHVVDGDVLAGGVGTQLDAEDYRAAVGYGEGKILEGPLDGVGIGGAGRVPNQVPGGLTGKMHVKHAGGGGPEFSDFLETRAIHVGLHQQVVTGNGVEFESPRIGAVRRGQQHGHLKVVVAGGVDGGESDIDRNIVGQAVGVVPHQTGRAVPVGENPGGRYGGRLHPGAVVGKHLEIVGGGRASALVEFPGQRVRQPGPLEAGAGQRNRPPGVGRQQADDQQVHGGANAAGMVVHVVVLPDVHPRFLRFW